MITWLQTMLSEHQIPTNITPWHSLIVLLGLDPFFHDNNVNKNINLIRGRMQMKSTLFENKEYKIIN